MSSSRRDRQVIQGAPAVTVSALVDRLGSHAVNVVVGLDQVAADVIDVVIHHPAESASVEPGDLVLAVGVDPGHAQAAEAVERWADEGAVGIVFKAPGGVHETVREAAVAGSVALLETPLDIAWGQLFVLLRTAHVAGDADEDVGTPLGDLFALAEAIAVMVGGPVTIDDPQYRVLAYSRADHDVDDVRRQVVLGRRVPRTWIRRLNEEGIYARLRSSDEVLQWSPQDPPGFRPRLAVAIRASGKVLGFIWVSQGARPFDDDARNALAEAARIAALHLVQHYGREGLDRQQRAETLQALLEHGCTPDVAAARLRLNEAGSFTLLGVVPEATEQLDSGSQALRDLVELYSRTSHRRVVQTSLEGRLYVLLVGNRPADRTLMKALATEIVRRASASLGVDLLIGVGPTVQRLAALPSTRIDVDRIIAAIRAYPESGPVADQGDVRAQMMLQSAQRLIASQSAGWHSKLDVLREHDAQHGSNYVATLRTYLGCFGSIVVASQRLGVHENTVRYRVRRLEELAGIDLDAPAERLLLELQLAAPEEV